MKLTNLKRKGRYRNEETGQEVNIWKGTNLQKGVDVLYFLYRNKRIAVSDLDFYTKWKKISE